MKTPNFIDMKVVKPDGTLTDAFRQVLSELFYVLQFNLSDEGYIVPQQSTANIAELETDPKYIASVVYDSDINKLKVNENGIYKTVTTS